MDTPGGFKTRRTLDAQAAHRLRQAKDYYPPIDMRAHHTADTIIIFAMVMFAAAVVIAAVLHWNTL